MEETKKGFLAIGTILFLCLAATAVLAFFGWNWLKNSGVMENEAASFSGPPINIERGELVAFLKDLGYACDVSEMPSNDDYDYVTCIKQTESDTFTLGITYSRKQNKPVAINLQVPKSERTGQKEIVAAEFAEVIRFPYKGSKPDAAAAWINQCMALGEVDTNSISKTISGVSFTFHYWADEYQLVIASESAYD